MENDRRLTRRSLLATTTALTLGVSGCLGGGTNSVGDPTTQQTDEPTTDQPTTEATNTKTTTEDPAPSLAEFDYPDGSGQGGIDARTFYQTHEGTVTGAGSVTVDINAERVISGDGQTFEDSTTETRELGSKGILVEREQRQTTETVWSPAAEDHSYVRMEAGFDTAFRIDNEGPSPNEVALLRQVGGYLRGGSWSEAKGIVEDGDGYAVVYESTGIADENQLRRAIPSESISQFDAEIKISDDGYLSEISFESTADQGPQTVEADTTTAFSSVGKTSPDSPDWTETAREQGVRFEAEATEDGTAIALKMVNGSDLPSDARLSLSTVQGRGEGTVPDALVAGNQVYLGLSNGGELLVRRDGVPDGATSLGNFASVSIRSKGFQFLGEQFQL